MEQTIITLEELAKKIKAAIKAAKKPTQSTIALKTINT